MHAPKHGIRPQLGFLLLVKFPVKMHRELYRLDERTSPEGCEKPPQDDCQLGIINLQGLQIRSHVLQLVVAGVEFTDVTYRVHGL
jgi:hypothetical protein